MKITISNGFDSLDRKIWKFYLKKYKNSLKNWDSSSKNCQKFLPQIGEFFFLKSNNLCTKFLVVGTIFLKSRLFLKSQYVPIPQCLRIIIPNTPAVAQKIRIKFTGIDLNHK